MEWSDRFIEGQADKLCVQDLATLISSVIFVAQFISICKVLANSNKSLGYNINALSPIGVLGLFIHMSFHYLDFVWKAPVLVLLISGCYYSLMVTKLIMSNVTSQPYT